MITISTAQILTLIGVPSLCASALTAVFHYLHMRWTEKHKKNSSSDELLLAIARILLIEMIKTEQEKGHTTRETYEVVEELYSAYHALNGNGVGTKMWEQYNTLEVH